jgi:hypothetical protein
MTLPINIDPKFIDVDFPTRPEFTFGDTGQRVFRSRRPTFEESVPLIPESEWQAEIEKIDANGGHLERMIVNIFDQKQEGSCVANASSQAHQITQAMQNGKENVVQLSAISLYKGIGSSPNSGANVSDALEFIDEHGVLPLNNAANTARFKHVMPSTGFYSKYPQGWDETANLFKGHESFELTSIAGLASASFRGYAIVVGRRGHSICYVRPTWKNGQLGFVYANSWTPQWGFAMGEFPGGFGLDTLNVIRDSADWAYCLRSVNTPPVLAA